MKTFGVIWISAVLATLCPGALSDIAMELDALRPDVEYLRGYWLKNPEEYDRQGRIVFSDKHEIRINNGFPFDYTFCPDNVTDRWTNETLYFENVHRMLKLPNEMLPTTSLYYKNGNFFRNSNRCASLTPLDDSLVVIQVPRRTFEADEKKTVVVYYNDLKAMSRAIEEFIETFGEDKDFALRTESEGFNVDLKGFSYLCKCRKDCRYVHVYEVRVTDPIPGSFMNNSFEPDWLRVKVKYSYDPQKSDVPHLSVNYSYAERRVSVLPTSDYSFIRYDRLKKVYYTPSDEVIPDSVYIRNFAHRDMLRAPVISTSVAPVSSVQPELRRGTVRGPIRKMFSRLRNMGPPLRRSFKKYQDGIFLGAAGGAMGLALLADAALLAGSLLK